ncbi:MAG: uncharacterized protein JWM64_1521 [Frankiales bacterium]|nr:uncharacterized protein [Frankiales bacterium]
MDLAPDTGLAYLRYAFGQMLAVATTLGEPLINERPTAMGTNPVGALVLHCCTVCEFWLGHVALGRPTTTRDRAAEFSRRTTLSECRDAVDVALQQAEQDVRRLARGEGVPHDARRRLHGGVGDDDAVVLHLLEEVFQHLGQSEVTKDVLLQARAQVAVPPSRTG